VVVVTHSVPEGGGGTRFFDQLKDAPVELEGPVSVVEGTGVTHLRYRVRNR
jgi:hypothetical protein